VDVVRDWDLGVSVPHSTPRYKTFKTYLNISKQRIEREPGTRLNKLYSSTRHDVSDVLGSFQTSRYSCAEHIKNNT
jgi:hypothetical protein